MSKSFCKLSLAILIAMTTHVVHGQGIWNNVPNQGTPTQSAPTQGVWNNTATQNTSTQGVWSNTPTQNTPTQGVWGNTPTQGGWSNTPTQLQSLPTESTWTPWPRVAQNPSAACCPGTSSSGSSNWIATQGAGSNAGAYQQSMPAPSGAHAAESSAQAGHAAGSAGCVTGSTGAGYVVDSGYAGGVGYGAGGAACAPAYGNASGYFPRNAFGAGRFASPWYFSASGLIMGRSDAPRVWTTYETDVNANQLMSTQDADPDWQGGFEVHLGRQIACSRWAIDAGFWMVDDFQAFSSQTDPDTGNGSVGVSSPLAFNDLEFPPAGGGDVLQDYFDSAQEHRLTRRNNLYNIELNLLETSALGQGCNVWTTRKMVGIRYFRFDEDLTFATLDLGGTWGGNGGADEVYLNESIENNLLGAQIGCRFDRRFGRQASFFITPKLGVYNNRINNRFDLRRGDGVAAQPTAFSGVAGSYPVESSTDTISFLSEMDLGLSWQATPRWSFFGGYRVMVLSGIGLADAQIPQYIVDIPEIADIDHENSLILHGAFFGAAYSL